MLKKELAGLAKQAAKVKVHALPEPKPMSKKDMEKMAVPTMGEPYDERPRIYLEDKEAPFLADWKSGSDHTLVLRVHVKDYTKHSTNDEKPRVSATLIITEIAAVPDSK